MSSGGARREQMPSGRMPPEGPPAIPPRFALPGTPQVPAGSLVTGPFGAEPGVTEPACTASTPRQAGPVANGSLRTPGGAHGLAGASLRLVPTAGASPQVESQPLPPATMAESAPQRGGPPVPQPSDPQPSDPQSADLVTGSSQALVPERNIRLRVAYDGTRYFGWQVQAESPTLQEVFERGVRVLTGQSVGVLSAGRTDSGVHALGQVVSVLVRTPIPPSQFGRALQPHLPPDVVVLDSCEVPPAFHATFSARWKTYRYVIDNSPVALPFTQNRAWALRRPLDVPAMHEAAQRLVGRHDFRCFETNWPNKATSVRTIHDLRVYRTALWGAWSRMPPARSGSGCTGTALADVPGVSGAETFVCLEVTADGFLYNMVRSITGTLINVGRGRWTAADIERILHRQNRSLAGSTAPACGLYLVHVEYDTPWPGTPATADD